jgi:hypothetical protein
MIETLAGAPLLTSCKMVSRNGEDPSNSPGVVMVEADEWDEVIYTIKGSEITLQSTGHFYAEPNACFRKESGVFELSTWNRMAELSNLVWRAWQSPEAPPLLEQAQCITAPPGAPSIPSGVEMKIWKGSPQKIIDSINSTQICSRISNLELLRNFVLMLGEASTIARQEGC